jgi:hypothetical protein
MGLNSDLFRGDPVLEAAAKFDAAHIAPGARGPHVRKIQTALNALDGARLIEDGAYGRKTAAAVLAYKRKRNIVNRAYQTQPDDIVGRMTVASIDAELVGTETRPRIVAVHPSAPIAQRVRSFKDFEPRSAAQAASRAKTLVAAPNPASVVTLLQMRTEEMLLQRGRSGSFTVLDGVGAQVVCWDREVGLVVDPAEPLAHGGMLPVTRKSHEFRVVAVRPGRSFVEARRPGPLATRFGDMFPLVVVEPRTKLTWRPKWLVTPSDRFRVNPWGVRPFGPAPVPGMLLKSAWVEFEGGVDPDESIAPVDFQLGLLQTVMASRCVATYVDANNRPTWTYTITQKSAPVRDTADPKGQREPPWYTTDARVSLDAARTVKSSDGPQMPVPWRTRNGKGRLVSTEGADAFFTWLAVRRKADKKVITCASRCAAVAVNQRTRFRPDAIAISIGNALQNQPGGRHVVSGMAGQLGLPVRPAKGDLHFGRGGHDHHGKGRRRGGASQTQSRRPGGHRRRQRNLGGPAGRLTRAPPLKTIARR